MAKALGFSETFASALETSMAVEMGLGQPELVVAELALLPMILLGKKIKQHHDEKKARKQQALQQSAEEQKFAEEEAYQKQLEEERQKQAEIDAENKRREEERQKQAEIDAENKRREEEAKQQQDLINEQNQQAVDEAVEQEYEQVSNLEAQREERLAIFSGQLDPNAPFVNYQNVTPGQQMPYNGGFGRPGNDEGPDSDNGGGHDPWRMPDGPGGGNDPDPHDDGIIIDQNGQPRRNQFRNPFWDMIADQTAKLTLQALTQKQDDEEAQKKLIEDLPENPTEEQKLKYDEEQQLHQDVNQLSEGQLQIQQQIVDVLTALGQEELTFEQSLVELDKIDKDLERIMNSRVKTTQIYSSTVQHF